MYCFHYLHLISSCLLNADLDDGVEAWQVQILVYIGSVVLLRLKMRGHSMAAKDEGPFNGFVDTNVPEL